MFNTMNPVRPNQYQMPEGGYGNGHGGNENQGNQQQQPQTIARGRAENMPAMQQNVNSSYQVIPQYQNNAQYQSYGMQNPMQPQPVKPAGQQIRSNKINIAQILKDFNNTIKAIGTPPELCDKVNEYLFAVGSQVKKENPAVNMIQSNLRSAAIVLDKYISETLNKDSKVVQNWLDALFLQRIDYHYNEDEVNKDFLVKFPQNNNNAEQTPPPARNPQPIATNPEPIMQQEVAPQVVPEQSFQQVVPQQYEQPQQYVQPQYEQPQYQQQPQYVQPQYAQPQQIEQPQPVQPQYVQPVQQVAPVPEPIKTVAPEVQPETTNKKYTSNPVKISVPKDKELKDLFIRAKKQLYSNNSKKAMDLFQKALDRASQVKDTETESKICFEIGKIYDDNDCLVQALSSYNRSSQATTDANIKTKAHFSMAQIYDDVKQIDSALDHYFTTISYAGRNDNFSAQSASLTKIANIYTDRLDEQAFDYYKQADELIKQTKDSKTKGFVMSSMADAYNQFDDPVNALHCYRDAVKNYTDAKSSFNVAKNYKDAAEIMLDFNQAEKAKALLQRAGSYADKIKDEKLIEEIKSLLAQSY